MPRFVGLKIINAHRMTRAEYNAFRGWALPTDENGADEGYLVEYVDGGPANTPHFAGYVSWSPKDVFERAYRSVAGLPFGHALELLKQGKRVARAGWNGKGMWLAYSPGSAALPAEKFWAGPNRDYAAANGGTADVLPCITMKTATGEILMGWLASQTDMLAEDWTVLE
ncbi:DUF2829 domain-containing protein [Burkholderia sp. Ac-20345]|nr:DUF2829 domain-containing protein [Burkholderia sp. Ac-20345]